MNYPSRLPHCLAKKIAMSEFLAEFPPHWLLPQLVTRSNHPFLSALLSAPPLLVVVTMVVEIVVGVVLVVRVVGVVFSPIFFGAILSSNSSPSQMPHMLFSIDASPDRLGMH